MHCSQSCLLQACYQLLLQNLGMMDKHQILHTGSQMGKCCLPSAVHLPEEPSSLGSMAHMLEMKCCGSGLLLCASYWHHHIH